MAWLSLGSKLYPSSIQRMLNNELTWFMQSLSRVRQIFGFIKLVDKCTFTLTVRRIGKLPFRALALRCDSLWRRASTRNISFPIRLRVVNQSVLSTSLKKTSISSLWSPTDAAPHFLKKLSLVRQKQLSKRKGSARRVAVPMRRIRATG